MAASQFAFLPFYELFRQKTRFSAQCLTLALLVLFIAFNLIVYQLFFNSLIPDIWSDRSSATDHSIPFRESSPLTRPSRHPFPPPEDWIDAWFAHRQLDFSTPPPPTSTPSSNFSTTPNKNNTNTNTTKDIKYDLSKALAIDTVYTWVNGSDPQLQAVKKQYQDASSFFQTPPPRGRNSRGRNRGDQTANRFRDMDELKYSIRSLYENGRELGGKIHVLTTDIDPQSSGTGQVPSWLDLDAAKGNLTLVHHASIFEDSTALPTFNSLAIESQIHHVPNLTDVFMYLNDDVFLGTRTLPADIWTPLYGFVFHMEPSLLVPPTILPMPTGTVAVGEWHSLQYTNFLLSNQFGPRHRSYLAHVPHVLSAPMLQEIQNIWPDAFYGTSTHRFRGEGEGRDVHVSFFMAHYVFEKERETMLSSYWMYRLDANQDGSLSWSERDTLIQRIQAWNAAQEANKRQNQLANFNRTFYGFVDGYELDLNTGGFELSGSSDYHVSGLDGYPFMLAYGDTSKSVQLSPTTPYTVQDQTQHKTCQFDVNFCLGSQFMDKEVAELDTVTSQSVFKRLAFQEFHCGDCLLHILRQTSTEPGLSSEILPVDSTSGAYKTVIADLAKYNYVVATSQYSFIQLQTPQTAARDLDRILSHRYYEAFFCINDNVSGDDSQAERQVREIFHAFLEDRFSTPSPLEKNT
ncbi:Xanthine phosphoribosyltransferase 1 [Podila verticillata]|nr:Xanthine phosphoribosyltransferase 1 [Podila verticillata]